MGSDKACIGGTGWARALGILFFLLVLGGPSAAFADWSPLIGRLVADGFDESSVQALFSRPEAKFTPEPMASKLQALLKKESKKPSPVSSRKRNAVYRSLLKEAVVGRARSYILENEVLLENISGQYCVPKEIIVSILLVETLLGEHLGEKNAFNTLASMALASNLETIRPYLPKKLITPGNEDHARTLCRRKADWAYEELKALILYSQWSGIDPLSLPGSIYGAIGLCQFMPSKVLSYGVDADQDGRIDLFVKEDALYSIANYLSGHGWQCNMDKTRQHRVIFLYNHSTVYAKTVLAVADKLRDKSGARR